MLLLISSHTHGIDGSVDGGVVALVHRRRGQVDNLRHVLGDLRHLRAHVLLVQLHLPFHPLFRFLQGGRRGRENSNGIYCKAILAFRWITSFNDLLIGKRR